MLAVRGCLSMPLIFCYTPRSQLEIFEGISIWRSLSGREQIVFGFLGSIPGPFRLLLLSCLLSGILIQFSFFSLSRLFVSPLFIPFPDFPAPSPLWHPFSCPFLALFNCSGYCTATIRNLRSWYWDSLSAPAIASWLGLPAMLLRLAALGAICCSQPPPANPLPNFSRKPDPSSPPKQPQPQPPHQPPPQPTPQLPPQLSATASPRHSCHTPPQPLPPHYTTTPHTPPPTTHHHYTTTPLHRYTTTPLHHHAAATTTAATTASTATTAVTTAIASRFEALELKTCACKNLVVWNWEPQWNECPGRCESGIHLKSSQLSCGRRRVKPTHHCLWKIDSYQHCDVLLILAQRASKVGEVPAVQAIGTVLQAATVHINLGCD